MVVPADWIRVDLSREDVELAESIAQLKQREAELRGFRRRGFGSIDTHRTGALGHVAAARYAGEAIRPETYAQERARGSDLLDGREVRTAAKSGWGLHLHRGDEGKTFIHALAHDRPVIWLVGTIASDEAFPLATWRADGEGDKAWAWLDNRHLHPLPEQNGYFRRAEKQLVDPRAVFWCEDCGGTHPISQHRLCRAGSA